ncbi:LysM peptidoglycan-binding domain-containing protein [Flavobacterium sp. xlx-214]|uniref:PBP1 and LysM peptidoglycan-binding domain-containing protein n=1 Tax=unclassified Flavobacterium TaxID=196869 RepID=UPI0013CFB414|nr:MULTISPECIES: LysM peptidoglycan-binding domain-containing protein [unclassified Flavobacterium]MBA5793082.1 LysM peptidoglycan-binding domain-containing protein [Flavobacterium sp. xlx-221]QMI82626.1 LysM peptidoglycan-binding domain-containing protein [Flavobacterium sp. xlx-214]
MKKIIFTISALICAGYSFAQTATKTHVVAKGENITQIAKKYNTTNNILFLLNPEAVDGVSENQVLKIPTTSEIQHQVIAKETVYGIAKQYNIAIEKLYDLNPGLKENGLKVGQYLNLTNTSVNNTNATTSNTTNKNALTTMIVEKGETIYGIAVKNNTTVSTLYELNPGLLENGLKVGQPLNVPVSKQQVVAVEEEKPLPPSSVQFQKTAKTITVQPKATIYSIAKANNVTQEQLLQWNTDLKNGLKEGSVLIVGYGNDINSAVDTTTKPSAPKLEEVKKGIHLSLVNDGSAKDLVMLLPFNISKNNFQNPSINQTIKEDVFLNMTLDFYSGAKLAIDDLKSKNYNLNIKFVDSKETNRSLDVSTLKNDFNFDSTDVIIGPFFQKNVDAVSESFKNQQTIIVSPLSTDKGKPYPRQVHTMPNSDIVKKEMMEYLVSKQQRIVAITDGKKTSASYFSTNYPNVSTIAIANDEKVSPTILKNLLDADLVNYIVFDATSLTSSVELINLLKTLKKDYKIQLVSLEKLDVLESSDVDINDLITLKYTFPSVTNDTDSNKKQQFSKDYKKIYGKNPSRFATRGYDVTYDVITRMFESDENSNIFDYGSQQVENKFAYINENGGVYNNAVYILYYDKDLTIKEAK